MVELSDYRFTRLWEDNEFVMARGRRSDGAAPILVRMTVSPLPAPAALAQLEHELALSDDLDMAWAVQPLTLERSNGRSTLVLSDPGGECLDRLLGRPLDVPRFLTLAHELASALGAVHRQGLIHKNIRPRNIFVDGLGRVRFTGFGRASRASQERTLVSSPDLVSGHLSHMAPEQSGRMNRSIDARSDLYSLGVVLYEMLTGALPFAATEPMEWIHCHIAQRPSPPSDRVAGHLPGTIEAIVLKLLSKAAEERYQTATGLDADLQACLEAWMVHGDIPVFPLAARDLPDRLLIPEKLYGRDSEFNGLVGAFERVVAHGTAEVVWITGEAGAGKSSLVNELLKVLVRAQGLFATGKFDQYNRNVPYSTLAQSIQSLVRQILGENDQSLARWRRDLQQALEPHGRLMTQLIPGLALIVGEQPAVPDVPPLDAQARFYSVFRKLLGVFAKPEHPLVLFLDDLQWLDVATLDLLGRLLAEPNLSNLLLVCAYREEQGVATQALCQTLERNRASTIKTQEIVVRPLGQHDLVQMLGDTLRVSAADAQPLAKLVLEKTGGNPFFAIQYITALAEAGLLTLDREALAWRWDIAQIRANGVTENVADLITERLGRVTPDAQDALKHLACLGAKAGSATIAAILDVSEDATIATLDEVARAGLVLRMGGTYAFVHDRVQEAAYALIPTVERAAMHLAIGRALASRSEPGAREEHVFEIVNQLNRGTSLLASEEERVSVAALNLKAGLRAKSATAHASAVTYLAAGCALLRGDDWLHHNRLAVDLELHRAECEFLVGESALAGDHLAALALRAVELVDRVRIVRLRMALYTTLDQTDRAIDVGLDFLRSFRDDWSARPADALVTQELAKLRGLLGDRPVETLIDLPLMDDPECLAVMDVLAELQAPASFTDKNLFHLTFLRMATLSMEHGNCDASACAYALLNIVLGLEYGDYPTALRFGQLGCDLVDKRGLVRFKARVHMFFATFVLPWTRHLSFARALLRRAIADAATAGDPTYGTYSRRSLLSNLMTSGEPLAEVQREGEMALAFARQAHFGLLANSFLALLILVHGLRGRADAELFQDGWQDEQGFQRHLEQGGARLKLAAARYWMQKMQGAFFAQDYHEALHATQKAETIIAVTATFIEVVDFHAFAALTRARLCDDAPADRRAGILQSIADHHRHLEGWAMACPENFASRAALVSAEVARLADRMRDAERLYEAAIQASARQGFVHYEGLANELAARFYEGRGLQSVARIHLANARVCYLRWGADALVQRLDERCPDLRGDRGQPPPAFSAGGPLGQLDVGTMLRASQALAIVVDLGALIETLMRITLEHAGAERGLLILQRDGASRVAARAQTSRGKVEVSRTETVPSDTDLPASALRYVLRTRESLVFDDASNSELLAGDEYVHARAPRSVLCLPILKQAQILGALYLENNLTPHAFRPETIAVLEFIAAQAAISLENAHLYSDLRRSEAFLAEGQRLSNTGSWSRNLGTGKLIWSEQNYRIFGRDPRHDNAPHIKEFMTLIHPDDLPAWSRAIETAIRDGRRFSHEFRILLRTGEVKHLHSVGRPVQDEAGRVCDYVGTTMDITDRKIKEEALRDLQAEVAHVTRLTTMGELAASIAHEVNQPLAAIVTNAETSLMLLQKKPPDLSGVRKAAQRIVRDGVQASDVIKNIRAMLQRTTPEVAPLSVNALIKDVLDLMRGELRRHAIATETDLAENLGAMIGDRVQLQQVMINLIKNSLEAMMEVPQGRRYLLVRTASDGERRLRVAVEDTGTGIDAEAAQRIFEPFFSTKPQGMGMGLSICRTIVETHGGHLHARAREPFGCCFEFTLAAAPPWARRNTRLTRT